MEHYVAIKRMAKLFVTGWIVSLSQIQMLKS